MMKDRLHRTGVKKGNHLVRRVGMTVACVAFSLALVVTVIAINVDAYNRYLNNNIVKNFVQLNYNENIDEDSILLDSNLD